MHTSNVAMTPAWARDILSKNTRNRPISDNRVSELMGIIKRGEWQLTHQGIAVATDGVLLDGQHRLTAIARTKKTLPVMLTLDADPQTFTAIDDVKKRSAADVLSIAGQHNSMLLASSLRILIAYRSGEARPWGAVRRAMSAQQILDAVNDFPGLTTFVAPGRSVYKRVGGSAGAFIAALYEIATFSASNDIDPSAWVDGLISGARLEPGDGRLAIASWIAGAGRIASTHYKAELIFMGTLRAYKAHLSGSAMDRLLVQNPATYNINLGKD